jgi:hypothetical protein
LTNVTKSNAVCKSRISIRVVIIKTVIILGTSLSTVHMHTLSTNSKSSKAAWIGHVRTSFGRTKATSRREDKLGAVVVKIIDLTTILRKKTRVDKAQVQGQTA